MYLLFYVHFYLHFICQLLDALQEGREVARFSHSEDPCYDEITVGFELRIVGSDFDPFSKFSGFPVEAGRPYGQEQEDASLQGGTHPRACQLKPSAMPGVVVYRTPDGFGSWDVASGRHIFCLHVFSRSQLFFLFGDDVWCCGVSRGGLSSVLLVSRSNDQGNGVVVEEFCVVTGKLLRSLPLPVSGQLESLRLLPSGEVVADVRQTLDSIRVVWDLEHGKTSRISHTAVVD